MMLSLTVIFWVNMCELHVPLILRRDWCKSFVLLDAIPDGNEDKNLLELTFSSSTG